MRKVLAIGCFALLTSTAVFAGPNYLASGSNLTYGSGSNTNSVMASTASNPAMMAYSMDKQAVKEGVQTNLWSSGSYFEYGPVKDFAENAQDVIDTLGKDNLTPQEASQAQKDANAILVDLGNDGYVQGGVMLHLPVFPIAVKSLGGSIVYDFNTSAMGYARVLDSPVIINSLNNGIETASSMYLKGSLTHELSMSYSKYLLDAFNGSFYAGVRAKLLSVNLTKSVMKFESLGGTDAGETLMDEITGSNLNTSTGFGIDIGVVYAMSNMKLGLSFVNVNNPTFDYGSIGGDCTSYTGVAKDNCNAANTFSNEIALQETHTMNSQAKLDGSFITSPNGFEFAVAADLNAALDPIGNSIQNVDLSVVDIDKDAWLKNLRIGISKNLEGSALTWLGLGATFFDVVQMDVSFPLETAQIDTFSLPRGLKTSFGVNISF